MYVIKTFKDSFVNNGMYVYVTECDENIYSGMARSKSSSNFIRALLPHFMVVLVISFIERYIYVPIYSLQF